MSTSEQNIGKPQRRGFPWKSLLAMVVILAGLVYWFRQHQASSASLQAKGRDNGLIPVTVTSVVKKDVPLYLDGIGTVQALNTVTVHSRIDGELFSIKFKEGQDVKAGEVLAEVDPLPYKAALAQVVAKKGQDEAQLGNARLDLKRYAEMVTKNVIARQQYDTQQSRVSQLEAAVRTDQAAVDAAQVQLNYTTIESPIEGRTGMRLMDAGNVVHASDSKGIVVITQLRPISVLFTLPEQDLPRIQKAMKEGDAPLEVLAMDREGRNVIARGTLTVINNEIDTTTGTIRLKATFPNDDLSLWPGQFVNVRLLVLTRKAVTVVPSVVVQHGPDGTYVFLVGKNSLVSIHPVTVGPTEGGQTVVDAGLSEGDQVVSDGQYKLQNGSAVKILGASPKASPASSATSPSK